MTGPSNEQDVVAMPSLKSDGTPDQTPEYKVLDPETGEQAGQEVFTEFRAVTQETVLPPTETDAAALVPEGTQGATPEESAGVAGSTEAAAESQTDPLAAREPDEPTAAPSEAAPSPAAEEAAENTGTETRPADTTPATTDTSTGTESKSEG